MLQQVAEKVEQKSSNVRVVFRNCDEDKSGVIDYEEFRRGLAHLGIALSDRDFQQLLALVDSDGSGSIDYNEFANKLNAPPTHADNLYGGRGEGGGGGGRGECFPRVDGRRA